MREYKFRAFDNVDKVMKYFSYGIFNRIPDKVEDLSEIMQYTDLKDMHGKEIYEGDILDCSYISPLSKEFIRRHYLITYEDGAYKAKLIWHSPYGDTWLYFENEKGAVIGNIYENPELLGGDSI